MMRWAYSMLLRFYPRRYRLEFGEEMLSVFTRVAEERRALGSLAYIGFCANEFRGLLGGALGEWPARVSLAAPLGGLATAAVLHTALYTASSKIFTATAAAVERSAIVALDEQAKLLLLLMASVLWLLFFLIVSMRLARHRR